LKVAGEGPRRAEWEALSQALGVRARMHFLGNVPDADLPALYRSADAFVLPSTSRAESFGTVLVEAMASGLPCVTTEIGTGTSYVVQDSATGLVVPPRSPEALASALGQLLGNAALRARMGAAGRDRALREFTAEVMVDRVERVYLEVLSQR
jgi:rhamnosyl/mannosyltransferase